MQTHLPRRLSAALLALTLVCSLIVPASAANATPSLNRTTASIRTNEVITLTVQAAGTDEEAFPLSEGSRISWTVDDPGIASISIEDSYPDEDGKLDMNCRVTGISPGQTFVTANCYDGDTHIGSYNCTIEVESAPIHLSQTDAHLSVGDRLDLTATVSGNSGAVTWEVTPANSVVTIDQTNGYQVQLYAVAAGTATVTARLNGSTTDYVFCTVVVTAPDTTRVRDVTLTGPTNPNVDPEGTLQLEATVVPSTARDKTVFWSSSDTSVARVSSAGVVTGVAPGDATITVTTNDGGFKAEYDVHVSGIRLEKTTLSLFVNKSETLSYECFGAASTITPTWSAVNPSIASPASQFVGRITGHYPGTTDIVATAGKYTATCTVNVSEDLAQVITADLNSNGTLRFSDLLSELNRRCQDKTEASLSYLSGLQVSTSQGRLYYRYDSPATPGHGVGGSDVYHYQASTSQKALSEVTFVPLASLNGTAEIEYIGTATNGLTFNGTIQVEVVSSGDLTYSTGKDQAVAFRSDDFTAMCRERNGHALSYVTFDQPAASKATLYYNYVPSLYSQKVDSATRYYAGSNPSLDLISFVPASGYTGTVEVGYHYTDTSGVTNSGTVRVHVGTSGTGSGNNVEYTTAVNQRLNLHDTEFNQLSQRLTSTDLRSIRFESLPVTSVGRMYLNYTSSSSRAVTVNTNYYRSSTPRISSLSFVPATGFSGTVTIPFTGTNTSGQTFTSNLIIHVGEGGGTINYTTGVDQALTFQINDFNSACRQINGTTINRVRFDLPPSGSGRLYTNYVSPSNTGSSVSASTYYYRNGNPLLSTVTFVPASGYSGVVSIPFSGYDDSGVLFEGTVSITVGSVRDDRVVYYSTTTNGAVSFRASDFNSVCRAITGDTLNYVRFDLPASRNGTLYYQYDSSRKSGTSVSSSTSYYRSGSGSRRLLDNITYVAPSTTGTITISYTGYTSDSESFTGYVEISVSSPSSNVIRYSGSSTPIDFRLSDFQSACQAALGNSLSYIQFNSLPAAGRLYLGYAGPNSIGSSVNTTTRYYASGSPSISQLTYLAKAEYQGLVSFSYTAYDTRGGSYSSTIEIALSNDNCYSSFRDVANGWDWAKPSIEYLRQSGITTGYSDGSFRPGREINRGEFTLMICRAFGFSTVGGNSGFPDVPSSSVYAGAIATARNLGIVQGNADGTFLPSSPITRQSAMTMICRALAAAGQTAPSTSDSILSSYRDGNQVSTYARSSVAALVQLGAVYGTSDMRLKPTEAISRAEMAVILHRVMAR